VSRPRLALIVVLCVAAGLLAGRALWSPDLPEAPRAAAAPGPERMPGFSLADTDGTVRSIDEWSGQALIVNFWATWCAPCRKEMPLLEQVHAERAGRGLTVIGIAIDRVEPVRSFVAETGVTYPILVGEQDAQLVAESFAPDFMALPLTVLVAPGGDILDVHVGELHPPQLAAFLDVLDRLAARTLTLAEARAALADG
jgi:thiol-disulfide isomerase/thioredoxin